MSMNPFAVALFAAAAAAPQPGSRAFRGGRWHYKFVRPRCGVHRAVHLRIRVRAAA